MALTLFGFTCCRGCLGALDDCAESGLCSRCWAGLIPLSEQRCPLCALIHDPTQPCSSHTSWKRGDALWDYHGGRPPLGSLLLPGIKSGEAGWKRSLLKRVDQCPLPPWTVDYQWVTSAPSTWHRRWLRGGDLAEECARMIAKKIQRPYRALLRKTTFAGRQFTRTESERRQLGVHAIQLRRFAHLHGQSILIIDDVWTTGTTLFRCSNALLAGGASETAVLAIFRALD